MFGYITADQASLTEEQKGRYGACYCGLCRCIQARYGFSGRLTLSYDMAFLILLLSSLYEPAEDVELGRCPVHPVHKRYYWTSRFTDYAADLNVLLAYYNCLDDWEDEKKVSRLALARRLEGPRHQIESAFPRQAAAIFENLQALHTWEQGPSASADRASSCFGALMGELFVWDETDYWSKTLRALGTGLGRFIYLMDACMDLHADEKRHRPNPLISFSGSPRSRADDEALLTMFLGDCTAAFEALPLVQDVDLLRNILYAGVWQKYNQFFRRRDKQEREGISHDQRSL